MRTPTSWCRNRSPNLARFWFSQAFKECPWPGQRYCWSCRRRDFAGSSRAVRGGRPQLSGVVHRLSTWSATSNPHGFPSCCSQAIWRTVEPMASPLLSSARIERASHNRRHRSTLRQLDRRRLERVGWRTTLEFRENHSRSIEGRLLATESMWVAEAEFEGRVIAAIEHSESRAWARLASIASA